MTALARRSVCVLALSVAGCAASSKQGAPPASAPGSEATQAPGSMLERESQKTEDGDQPERPTGGYGYAQPPQASLDDAESTLEGDFRALTRALSTAKDCELARKALDSMKRSADRICELNGPGDPGERCAKARERVDAASDNVRRCKP